MLLQKSIAKELLPACVVLQIMGHDLCASVEMEMFELVFDCYGWSAMICTSLTPYSYCAHLWTFVHCFVSIYRCFLACFWKMYDVWYNFSGTDKAIPQRWSSQQPTSRRVTTGVAWTLFTVWTRVLPLFSPPVGWWIYFSKSLKVVDKYVEESDFMYKITHMYIIYKWFIVKIQHVIDVHIIGSLYQLIQLVVLSFSWLQLERHFSGWKARRALRIEICRVLWGKDRHEFVDVHICVYICFVQFKINQG